MNDQEILHKYGLSDEWVEKDSARVEDETQSDNLTGVYVAPSSKPKDSPEPLQLSVWGRVPRCFMAPYPTHV